MKEFYPNGGRTALPFEHFSVPFNPTNSKTCLYKRLRSSSLPNNKISISTLPEDKVAQKPAGNILPVRVEGGKESLLCAKSYYLDFCSTPRQSSLESL